MVSNCSHQWPSSTLIKLAYFEKDGTTWLRMLSGTWVSDSTSAFNRTSSLDLHHKCPLYETETFHYFL